MTNTSCIDSDLGLPIGATGAAGQPLFHSMSFTLGGSPFITTSTSYIEVGRFIFSKNIATVFDSIKTNIWVTAGTSSFRVIDLITSTVVYENTAVTSTSATNIETITGQSIYFVASALLSVQIKSQSGANSTNIGSIEFYYD